MIEYIVPYTNTILMSVYIITTLKNQISYLKRYIIYIYIYILHFHLHCMSYPLICVCEYIYRGNTISKILYSFT